MDDALREAYRNTTFQAETPVGKVAIRIGKCSADVDELLRRNNATEWGFITAHNPASQVLTPEENRERHKELEADVRTCGLTYFQGEGIGADPEWLPETSLLILGLDCSAAIELGAKYGQNAIVYGKLGIRAGCRVAQLQVAAK